MNRNTRGDTIAILSTGWVTPLISYGWATGTVIYAVVEHGSKLLYNGGWTLALFVVALAHGLVNISETEFILTVETITVRKPFLFNLIDKTYSLDSLLLVECQYATGMTVRPSMLINLKNGRRRSWFLSASQRKVKNFLAELEKLGVETKLSGNRPDWDS